MRTPRDTRNTETFPPSFSAAGFDVVAMPTVINMHPVGKEALRIHRADFDALVDWYIGTPAIRAALKAKDEEIARLRADLNECILAGEAAIRCIYEPRAAHDMMAIVGPITRLRRASKPAE